MLLYYIVGVNILAFLVYGIDKWQAKKGCGAYQKPHCFCWPLLEVASAHGLV